MFLAARAVLLSMRASEDFGCAEKLSAAVAIKPDCCRPPAVVSIFTDSAACVLSFYAPPLHYRHTNRDTNRKETKSYKQTQTAGGQREVRKDRQPDRHTQTERHTPTGRHGDRQADTETNRKIRRQTGRHGDRQADT